MDEVYEDADEDIAESIHHNQARDIGGGGDTGIVIDIT